MRTLIIEDEISVQKALVENLSEYGYRCDVVETLKEGEYYLDIRNYDLVLMSSLLQDGLSSNIIPDIKANTPRTVVIVLSENNNNKIEIEALTNGADDVVKKPLDFEVLIARIEARLKQYSNDSDVIEIEDLTINVEKQEITYKDRQLSLQSKPLEVLVHLARNRDRIISKEELLDALWVEPELVTPNVIDVAVNQIRQKIDKPCDIITIETVRRRGYKFCYPTHN